MANKMHEELITRQGGRDRLPARQVGEERGVEKEREAEERQTPTF
jgi:hypothetical protein